MALAPVVVPRAIAADLARAVIGPDDPAVAARIIIGRPVAVVARTEVVATMPVGSSRREMLPGDSRRPVAVSPATAKSMPGANPAATEPRAATSEAAAMKGRAAATAA